MNEAKKKVFTLKKLLIIGVIILLIIAMSPLFWMGALASSFYDIAFITYQDKDYVGKELYILISLEPTSKNIKKYEEETFTALDFGGYNIKKVVCAYYYAPTDEYKKVPTQGESVSSLGITLFLTKTDIKSAKKTMARLMLLGYDATFCVLNQD